jgi:hypothetical protein
MSDFITECNEYKVPEQDFVGAWCSRCRREDCVRSSQGTSRFDVRTKTWQERLFTKVPKLPETDPRFPGIAAKMFQETDKTVQAHGWDAPPPPMPEPSQVESPPPAPVSVGQYTRAPNQSGRVLGTAPAGWTPKEAVIRPGTRIKLGGGGVGEGSDGSKA